VIAPDEELAGKQVDERHRDHVADDAHQISGQHRQAHAQPDGDGTAQLNDGHHGNEKHQQIILEHSFSFFLALPLGELTKPMGFG